MKRKTRTKFKTKCKQLALTPISLTRYIQYINTRYIRYINNLKN